MFMAPMLTTWKFHDAFLTEIPKPRVFAGGKKSNSQSLHEQVTCPSTTKMVVLNRERLYRQGDVLKVRVIARDAEGRRKTHGGDFLRARLIGDRSRRESSAGHVTDHGNGGYTVQFPLYWVGGVSVRIQLVHPSEAVEVLRRVRDVPNKRTFHCKFVDVEANIIEERQCFSSPPSGLPAHRQCDFSTPDANGTWFCERPETLPCGSIDKCKLVDNEKQTTDLLSQEEKKLFKKPYVEEELSEAVSNLSTIIHVQPSEEPSSAPLPPCPGNESSSLSPGTQGHWSRGVWRSSICNVRVFKPADVRRCLSNKTVYIQGDSTVRQWYERLQAILPLQNVKQNTPVLRSADNTGLSVDIHFRFHHVPIEGHVWFAFSELSYAPEQLDLLRGGPGAVVVLSLWAHFTAEPLGVLRARLHAIRHAIHRLQRRHPGTHVFIRTGTTREHKGQGLRYYLWGSDWLAYKVTEMIREIFRPDPDVVLLDFWDMTVCQWGKDNVHPDLTVVDSQLNMLLSHVCPE
ncbi:NXPE family member 3-like [Branchiostoma lanceolatum]|uniref:NXPE family member 3-like n=1 Tax=Branchiostoma lanceolatum TaxID=7740 RepID=UPI0034546C3B